MREVWFFFLLVLFCFASPSIRSTVPVRDGKVCRRVSENVLHGGTRDHSRFIVNVLQRRVQELSCDLSGLFCLVGGF
jgi:hypothetical protein